MKRAARTDESGPSRALSTENLACRLSRINLQGDRASCFAFAWPRYSGYIEQISTMREQQASLGALGSIKKATGFVQDDDLLLFEAFGAAPLPVSDREGYVENENAQIWYASYGSGPTLILLHGGLGNSRNWGYQLPELLESGYQVIVLDSRGHGRSTRDERPYSYELMGSDILAVMDALQIERAVLVGWSDGACTALILGDRHPSRVGGVVFFACNMDPSGTKPFEPSLVIDRCLRRHRKDYSDLSTTPNDFESFFESVGQMQRTQPNYSAEDLARIHVPVVILHAEFDEFIRHEHAEYLAETIPHARLQFLAGVSHFAPVQRPELFTAAIVAFLREVDLVAGFRVMD
jgi:pimeloyl-ACP methyl ester carboxylesterase